MRAVLFTLLMLIPMGEVHAIFYNNTEVIEIGDAEPDVTPESGGSGGGTDGTGMGGSSSGGTDSLNDSEEGSSGTSGGSVSGGGGGEGGGGADSGNTGEESIQDLENQLIDLLSTIGALIGAGSGAGSGLGGGAGADGEGGFNVRIVGEKVRSAFENNLDLRELLSYWRADTKELGAKEYGLIAASTALRDSNVQEVSFTASRFEIVYRSRSYLLGVIPWSLPVRVSVVPEASIQSERVQVALPWYSFFVRKFFTAGGLQKSIDDVIAETKAGNSDPDANGTALLFEAVADHLRRKVGTIADSVLLGVEPQ